MGDHAFATSGSPLTHRSYLNLDTGFVVEMWMMSMEDQMIYILEAS